MKKGVWELNTLMNVEDVVHYLEVLTHWDIHNEGNKSGKTEMG